MNSSLEFIIVERTDGIVKLVFNRPPLNILNIRMLHELNSCLESLVVDSLVRLLVVTGQGKAFSAGVDVGEHLPDKAEEMLATFHQTFDLLSRVEAPTLAVLNGVALGGGCEIAVFCDMVIAAESAKLGQPEIKLATLPPVAAAIFPRLCGIKKSFELLLTGESVSAREAEALGLVNKVVADAQLQAEVEAFIQRLTSLSPSAIKQTKKAILGSLRKDFQTGLRNAEAICLEMLMKDENTHEGLQAFLEKRKPRWKG